MWISVHDNVIGGKLRKLAKEIGCSQNEALGLLIRLWLWGLNNADKEGKLIEADLEAIADVLSVGLDKQYDSEDAVNALVATEWIDMVGEDIYIHDWTEWQMQWNKLKELQEQNAERQRRWRNKKREMANADAAPSPKTKPEELKEPNKPKAEKKPSGYIPAFEEFWKSYPRKVGKGEAYKKYQARLRDGYSEEELLEAAINYAAKCASEKTEDKYIKHAKTFLSDTLPFTDYIRPKQQSQEEPQGNDEENPFGKYL